MELRDYQKDAVEAIYDYCRYNKGENACCVLPTGSGKTPVLAQICKDVTQKWGCRVLILTHQKELLEQARDKLVRFEVPEEHIGIYCAGLKQKRLSRPVTLASIQSIWRSVKKLIESGEVRLVIVDEAHRITPSKQSQYGYFFEKLRKACPAVRIVGLTATPYRMDGGDIYGEDKLFQTVCYEKSVLELIEEKYLSPLVSCGSTYTPDTTGVRIKHGDFDSQKIEELYNVREAVEPACREILEKTAKRHHVLIFTCSIDHCEMVKKTLVEMAPTERIEAVHSKMLPGLRDSILEDFKSAETRRFLVNVDILTTGFDAPNIDAVVLLRPTASKGLYTQMVGRGLRLHESKEDCLILDYGWNIRRHGPIGLVRKATKLFAADKKEEPLECQYCHLFTLPSMTVKDAEGNKCCPGCGSVLIAKRESPGQAEKKQQDAHDVTASTESVVWTPAFDKPKEMFFYPTGEWAEIHTKAKGEGELSRTVKLTYLIGPMLQFNSYLCPEHDGFARGRFVRWWKDRMGETIPIPTNCYEVMKLICSGGLEKVPTKILVSKKSEERFWNTREVEWGVGFRSLDDKLCSDCGHFRRDGYCKWGVNKIDPMNPPCAHFYDETALENMAF